MYGHGAWARDTFVNISLSVRAYPQSDFSEIQNLELGMGLGLGTHIYGEICDFHASIKRHSTYG